MIGGKKKRSNVSRKSSKRGSKRASKRGSKRASKRGSKKRCGCLKNKSHKGGSRASKKKKRASGFSLYHGNWEKQIKKHWWLNKMIPFIVRDVEEQSDPLSIIEKTSKLRILYNMIKKLHSDSIKQVTPFNYEIFQLLGLSKAMMESTLSRPLQQKVKSINGQKLNKQSLINVCIDLIDKNKNKVITEQDINNCMKHLGQEQIGPTQREELKKNLRELTRPNNYPEFWDNLGIRNRIIPMTPNSNQKKRKADVAFGNPQSFSDGPMTPNSNQKKRKTDVAFGNPQSFSDGPMTPKVKLD